MKKTFFCLLLLGSLFVVPFVASANYALLPQTGMVPVVGNYSFSGSAVGTNMTANGYLSVSSGIGSVRTVSFSPEVFAYGIGYSASYTMSVNNGEFHYQNGNILGSTASDNDSGKTCPTEGFRIIGHFNTPYSADGTIYYVFSCRIWKTVNFTSNNTSLVAPPTLKTITVSPLVANLTVGKGTQQLTATKLDQFGNPIVATVVWTSSNPAVATVNSSGLVTPIANGTANITASSGGIKSEPVVITSIKPVLTTINITPATASLTVGKGTQQLTATKLDQQGNPFVATVIWTSSNKAVATVNSYGLVTPIANGTANITASSGTIKSVPAVISVTKLVLTTINITPSTANLTTNLIATGKATQQLKATTLDQFGNPFTASVTWTSSTSSVATVNSSGLVTLANNTTGTTNITASNGTIKSVPAVISSMYVHIKVSPLNMFLAYKGETQQITATIFDQNNNPVDAKYVWTSSNNYVATVSSTGLVTAVARGWADITASIGSFKNVARIYVGANPPAYPLLSQTSVNPNVGDYPFSVSGSSFSVLQGTGSAKIVSFKPQNYTSYLMSVNNGEFHFQNGIVAGNGNDNSTSNLYPTDGFRITGHFDTPTSASGVISYVYNGKIQKTVNFTATVIPPPQILKTITISPLVVNLTVGISTQQLTATALDQDGKSMTVPITWTHNTASVATVSSTGLVTPVGAGTANITASSGGIISAPSVITVNNPTPVLTTINLTPATVNAILGMGLYDITASTLDQFGNYIATAPITWTSSDPTVAMIEAGSGLLKAVTPVNAGTTTITASVGNVVSSPSVVIVAKLAPFLRSISLSPYSALLYVGGPTKKINASLYDQYSNPIVAPITWTSSNPAVATVDANGYVTAVSMGQAQVSASGGSIESAPSSITVSYPPATGYSYTIANVGNTVERKLFYGQQHFMTIILDSNKAIAIRPHPGLDINGWGSSLYLQPFLPGATLRGTNIQTGSAGTDGISFGITGVVSQGTSGSYGTFSSNLKFSFDPSQKKITGSGTYDVSLSGALSPSTGDLNLYKLASNYLMNVPLLDGTTGDTGDMKSVNVSPSNFTWIPRTGSTYPQDYRNPLIVEVIGDYNQVDTEAQGYAPIAAAYKPSMKVVLSSNLTSPQFPTNIPLIFGGSYNAGQSAQFWSDNVGITPLVLKSSSYTDYHFDVTFDSTAISGDH